MPVGRLSRTPYQRITMRTSTRAGAPGLAAAYAAATSPSSAGAAAYRAC